MANIELTWRFELECYVRELRYGGVYSAAEMIAEVWTRRLRMLWFSAVILVWRCIGWLYGMDWRDMR